MSNKKIQKIIVYIMVAIMAASSILFGLSAIL